MKRLKLFIVLGFAIMFLAGLEVGRQHTSVSSLKADWHRAVAAITGRSEPAPATQPAKAETKHLLFGEIELTPAQDDQVHKIFHDARTHTDLLGHQFHEFDRERDEEIIAILDAGQKFQYDEILADHDARTTALRTEIRTEMEKAGKDVRAILTSEQQAKYDAVTKNASRHGPGNGPWRGGQGGHRNRNGAPDSGPTTSPDTAPATP